MYTGKRKEGKKITAVPTDTFVKMLHVINSSTQSLKRPSTHNQHKAVLTCTPKIHASNTQLGFYSRCPSQLEEAAPQPARSFILRIFHILHIFLYYDYLAGLWCQQVVISASKLPITPCYEVDSKLFGKATTFSQLVSAEPSLALVSHKKMCSQELEDK